MNTFATARLRRAAAAVGGAGALMTGLIAAAATPAGAATLACGDTITSSVTLHSNLNCSAFTSGPALIIGAPGVTVNLDGHTILGPGYTADTPGIYSTFSGFRAEHGTVSNFFADVAAVGPDSSTPLTGVVMQHLKLGTKVPLQGIGFFGGSLAGAKITHVSASDLYAGVFLGGSKGTAVSDSNFHGPYFGIYDVAGNGNAFTDNEMSNVISDGIDITSQNGLAPRHLPARATRQSLADIPLSGDMVTGNSIAGKGAVGIAAEFTGNVLISGNSLNHLYTGIEAAFLLKSRFSHNKGEADAFGIRSALTESIRFASNKFEHGQIGIETDLPFGDLLQGNVTNENSEFGSYVWSNNDQTTFSALLSGNTGNKNRFGLYSQFPTSGSGNHASRNKVVNCFNVSCVQTKSGTAAATLPPHQALVLQGQPKAIHFKH